MGVCVLVEQLAGGRKTNCGGGVKREVVSNHRGACSFGNKVTNKTIGAICSSELNVFTFI